MNLFIIGNGFDLAHGVPSKYSDFKSYILKIHPESKNDFANRLYLEDYESMTDEEFSARLIIYAMNKAAGAEWNNFEDALGYLNFQEKLPTRSREAQEIDDENDIIGYLQACDLFAQLIQNSTLIWRQFFNEWIRKINFQIKKDCIKNNKLKSLFEGKENLFLSFNYTTVLEDLYGIKTVTHIHKKAGQELIFGHGYDEPPLIESQIWGSTFDDIIMMFKKDSSHVIRKNISFFRQTKKTIDKVYSYGFSYSKPDAEYIKLIIKNISPEAIWHFSAYEEQNRENMRIKKVKLRNYGFKGEFAVFDDLTDWYTKFD